MRGRATWILENRGPLVIADIAQETNISTESTTRQIGIRGYLAVPLFSKGGDIVGVMRALTYQPREFTQEEVDLLQQLANGTAVALENARLFQETERRAREQAVLNDIAAATSQSLHLDELLQIALDKVLAITGRDRAYIRLRDPLTGNLILATHRGISQEYERLLRQPQTPGGKSDRVLQSGEPVVVYDPERFFPPSPAKETVIGRVTLPRRGGSPLQSCPAPLQQSFPDIPENALQFQTAACHSRHVGIHARPIAFSLHLPKAAP